MDWIKQDTDMTKEIDVWLNSQKNDQISIGDVTVSTEQLRHYWGNAKAIIEGGDETIPDGMFNGQSIEEAIVVSYGRPSLLVKNGRFEEPESKEWKRMLATSKGILESILPSVGRVELRNHLNYEWVGTAWLVAEDIAVTNRHVAEIFARNNSGEFVFRQNAIGKTIRSSIDFVEEHLSPEERQFSVQKVLYIAEDSDPDIAFLQLRTSNEDGQSLAPQIRLAEYDISSRQNVALIGYPARDSRSRDPGALLRIFNSVYDVKRLAPGKTMSIYDQVFTHDSTSLGGCSGAPLIDLDSGHGEAVGLHFAGKHQDYNVAVKSTVVLQALSTITRV